MSIYLFWGFWYAVCAAVVHNVLQAWLGSSFPIHVWNTLIAKSGSRVYGRPDMVLAAFSRFGAFGELFVCPICAGTWITLLTSAVITFCAGLPVWFVIVATLSIPGIVARIFPQHVSPAAQRPTSKEHPVILDIVREMTANPEGAAAAKWAELQKEFAAPSSPEAVAIMASHAQKMKMAPDENSKSKLMRATLGRLYDLTIKNKS